jgi:hypothetical protein
MHLEGFHIIQQPSYMSMYPPGQGLILAAGQVLGHPWIGQLLATALMCSCLCWMLQGWLPAPWALVGACLAVLRLALVNYWINSYLATSLPALGGILVLGAFPRIKRHARARDALLMGLGCAILANTRPFEGFVFCLPIGAAMLAWLIAGKKIPTTTVLRRVVMPLVLIFAATGGAMSYYFWRLNRRSVRHALPSESGKLHITLLADSRRERLRDMVSDIGLTLYNPNTLYHSVSLIR